MLGAPVGPAVPFSLFILGLLLGAERLERRGYPYYSGGTGEPTVFQGAVLADAESLGIMQEIGV